MASADKPDPESAPTETANTASSSSSSSPASKVFSVDVILRLLVFAASVTSVVVMVTSKQTKSSGLRNVPAGIPVEAKFSHSPGFIYFVAALSVAGLYTLITALASISIIFKSTVSPKFLIHFAFFDVLVLGLVASATGTAGGVAYVGLKGNKHVMWVEVCYAFDRFCRHIGSAIAVSLFASVLLVFLVWLSLFSVRPKIK